MRLILLLLLLLVQQQCEEGMPTVKVTIGPLVGLQLCHIFLVTACSKTGRCFPQEF